MNKVLVITIGLLLSSQVFADSAFDQGLVRINAVDANYVYKDMTLVNDLFKTAEDNFASTLPIKVNILVENTAVVTTPFYSRFDYRLTLALPADELAEMKQWLSSTDNLKNLCIKSFYPAKYMQANNHKLVYSYRDIDDKAIADVTLTTETCKKAISTTS